MVPDLLGPAVRLAREALYVSVGAGVLAFQRVQVQRRELEQRFRPASPTPTSAEQ